MPIKLLVVDDCSLIRDTFLDLLLTVPGVDSIHTADDLGQAMALIRDIQPNLALVDLHLPDGHAASMFETMKWLAPAMTLAVLSNDADEHTRKACKLAGADWFFDKSSEFESAMELVRSQATRSQLS